jgi:hypothetical protein
MFCTKVRKVEAKAEAKAKAKAEAKEKEVSERPEKSITFDTL